MSVDSLFDPYGEYQPRPTNQNGDIVFDRVLKEIEGDSVEASWLKKVCTVRAEAGKEKHGDYLRTFNGRDAYYDMVQEWIDMIFYLMQEIMELEKSVKDKGLIEDRVSLLKGLLMSQIAMVEQLFKLSPEVDRFARHHASQ